MRYWDVFHSATLEAERSLTTDAVRQALANGELGPNDLVRPAGASSWARIGESTDFDSLVSEPLEAIIEPDEPPPPVRAEVARPSIEQEFHVVPEERGASEFEIDPDAFAAIDRDELRSVEADSEEEFEFLPEPEPTLQEPPMAAVILDDEETESPDHDELNDPIRDIDFEELDPQDEDEAAAEFTFTRNKADTVEELDLAAMVDVAFQLVLFFLVTAQVVLFKTLEVPKPNEDKPPDAAQQSRAKSVDELEKDYILVEVDAAGHIKIDRQAVPASRPVLVEKLRKTREETHRKGMLLSADFATRHEHAVLVFDVANEIDLKIAIAQPAAKK
jgi:biopolymer transport protein ExbD